MGAAYAVWRGEASSRLLPFFSGSLRYGCPAPDSVHEAATMPRIEQEPVLFARG
jgi:hypothetical protein